MLLTVQLVFNSIFISVFFSFVLTPIYLKSPRLKAKSSLNTISHDIFAHTGSSHILWFLTDTSKHPMIGVSFLVLLKKSYNEILQVEVLKGRRYLLVVRIILILFHKKNNYLYIYDVFEKNFAMESL